MDPISELDAMIEAIVQSTGMFPNRMVIGYGAFRALRDNKKLKAELAGTDKTRVTIEKLKDMLIHPGIDIRLSSLTYDERKPGATGNKKFVLGGEVLLFIGQDNPSLYDPSFAKTFATDGSNIDSVRSYADGPRLDVYAVDWTEDTKVTSAIAARRFLVS